MAALYLISFGFHDDALTVGATIRCEDDALLPELIRQVIEEIWTDVPAAGIPTRVKIDLRIPVP